MLLQVMSEFPNSLTRYRTMTTVEGTGIDIKGRLERDTDFLRSAMKPKTRSRRSCE
jgi:hypothetical protein